MDNPKVVVRLYPADEDLDSFAREIVNSEANKSLWIPSIDQIHDVATSVASTASNASMDGNGDGESLLYESSLQLHIDSQQSHDNGFIIGRSPDCDVVVPDLKGLESIAEYHCAILFDGRSRLILRDLQEPHLGDGPGGTAVAYNGQGGYTRRSFTWILFGDDFVDNGVPIVVTLSDTLKFRVVVSLDNQSDAPALPTRPKGATGGRERLGLTDNVVEPNDDENPKQRAILVKTRELGRGAQATVSQVWNVSTGLEYASKDPLDRQYWQRLTKESELLKSIHHEHIVQRIFFESEPAPSLILEYVPLGSIYHQAQISPIESEETLKILRQGTDALRYLHGLPDPIAHRDIKPQNILVQSRDPLHIKLSDFGLSKESNEILRTIVGTQYYMAPEIFEQESYDESVDIWSLGVVVYGFAHALPIPRGRFDGSRWAENIVQVLGSDLKNTNCPLLALVAKSMLIIDPEERSCANECYEDALRLSASSCCGPRFTPEWSISGDPMSLDSGAEETICRARQIAEDGMHFTQDDARYARSGAPAPDSLLSDFAGTGD